MEKREEEKDRCIGECANLFLSAMGSSPEERLKVLQKAFMLVAEKEDDSMASKLLNFIIEDNELAEMYRLAGFCAAEKHCQYFRSIYWQLPDRSFLPRPLLPNRPEPPALVGIKLEIIRLWMKRWRDYDRDPYMKNEKKVIDAFNFLLAAYGFSSPQQLSEWFRVNESEELYHKTLRRGRCISKEEKDGILKLFREYTDFNFTPEMAEKWLKQPNVPEEIQKIFIIARARNGGMALVERDMKNAELLKPLDTENRSKAALKFHKNFCEELAKIDRKIKNLLLFELKRGPCIRAAEICIDEIKFANYQGIEYELWISVYYAPNNLSDAFFEAIVGKINCFFSSYKFGHYSKVNYILKEGEQSRSVASSLTFIP